MQFSRPNLTSLSLLESYQLGVSPLKVSRSAFHNSYLFKEKNALKKSLEAPKKHFKDDDTKGRGKYQNLMGNGKEKVKDLVFDG
jgi:hypothetical protein